MSIRKVRVLINRKSGVGWSLDQLLRAFDRHWETPDCAISYQFTQSKEDAVLKTHAAIADGVDTLLVAGGDGTVSSIGAELVGTDVALGVIPLGSGNGFARHFDIPLNPAESVKALASARKHSIDVGLVGDRPFLVSCSTAWDAALVETFDKSPVRGFLPYVVSGVVQLFEYKPQPAVIKIDGEETIRMKRPMIITCANLSQFGGGTMIAPDVRADDGVLDLVLADKKNLSVLIGKLHRMFGGSIAGLPSVIYKRFKSLTIERDEPAVIQIDGELVEWGATIDIRIKERALTVLIP